MSSRGDWQGLKRLALRQGWRISTTGKSHEKWLAPDGKTIIIAGGTPSDRRALNNHEARMRRAGFK